MNKLFRYFYPSYYARINSELDEIMTLVRQEGYSMIFDVINEKLDEILKIHAALPTWIPLTKVYARECGYTTIDGLRKWCINNLPPDKFEKHGKNWYIHISVIHRVKRKLV